MTKSILNMFNVVSTTSHHYATEKHHQNNVTIFFPVWPPPNQNFWLCASGRI